MQSTLLVSEIFRSIQGEGPYAGYPSTFIRLAFCNLHCTWCDTTYTWRHPVHYQKVDVRNLRIPRGDIVVITGGEPLLQQRLLYEALVPFVIDHIIQFETNGTVLPKELVGMPATYVVSPKLSNNGADPLPRRIRLDTLRWFAARGAHFKFVVGSEEDVREVDELVREVRPAHIWLMPLGSTPEEVASRAPMVAQACLDRGWRYSDRLHIRMWGNERGR